MSDYDCSDRMFRFHQIRESSKTDNYYSSWYIFKNFDVFTHTATSTGLQLTQILNGLTSMLNSYRRLPAILVIIMNERLMNDRALLQPDLQEVLRAFCKKLIRLIECWLEKIPSRAKPTKKTQIYITKPLPKPSALVQNIEKLKSFSSIRREFNTILVSVVKEYGIGFVNVGITQEDGSFFIKANNAKYQFTLSKQGLDAYWSGLSSALSNLAETFLHHAQPTFAPSNNDLLQNTSNNNARRKTYQQMKTKKIKFSSASSRMDHKRH